MSKSIENKIRLKVFFIYALIAIICGGIIYYIYNFKEDINQYRESVNDYNKEFIATNALIKNVQDAQSSANYYKFSRDYAYYNKFETIHKEIKSQIDTLSHFDRYKNNEKLAYLYEIDTLLSVKGSIVVQITDQYDLLDPLYKKLGSYNNKAITDKIIATLSKQDTLINTSPQQKNLWKRIGAVFSPKKGIDTTVVISKTQVDTLSQEQENEDTQNIVAEIMKITQEVNKSYINQISAIERKTNTLIASDQEISIRLSDLLIYMHEDTLESILNKIQSSETLLNQHYRNSIFAGILVLMLVSVLILLIISDVNKGYEARRAVEEAKKRTEEIMEQRHKLLLSVSHDIKAPLSSIMGYLDIWDHKNITESEHKKIASMQNSGKHILALLSNLLEFSQLELQKNQIIKSNIDAIELFDEVAEMFEPLAAKKSLEFDYKTEIDKNRYISTDYLKLKQVLINILSNSVKYTSKGKIEFLAQEEGSNIVFTISDTGVGIPEDKLESVFQPFSRIENESSAEGSGFGMFVVKGLVELLQGSINVTSEINKGTSVQIRIPVEKVSAESLSSTLQNTLVPVEQYKILVIDDDEVLLTVLSTMLKKLEQNVTVCNNLNEFEQQINNINNYDFVITDMEMGSYNGLDILKKIRNINATIPVYVMTARGDYSSKEAKNKGFDDFLEKPFTFATLSSLLNIKKPVSLKSKYPSIYEMFDGDEQIVNEIFKTFVESTNKNIAELEKAVETGAFEKAQAISHKMLPMFAQIGEDELVVTLKKMDSMRSSEEDKYPQWKSDIISLTVKTKEILDFIERSI